MEKLFNQASFLGCKCLLIVFVLMSDIQTSKTTSTNVVESNNDVENLIDGKIHFIPMFWDSALHKMVSIFNISEGSPLHIILSRERRSHCEMFYLQFKHDGDKRMIVCVAELHEDNYLKEKCHWVNNTGTVVVNQGNLYGMPNDCGPWYLTVFVSGSTSYSNATRLAVEVSGSEDTIFFRWFRVISNIAFIPGILIAFKRRLYAECIVYFLTFSVSCVYHLCEAELHCFKGYTRLHYSDYYASDLSIIVTIWAMTGIKEPLKHHVYLAIAIMLQFAVMETTRSSYHFYVNLIFSALPLGYLTFQYIYRNIKYKECFPNRKRWAFNLIPGIILAVTGALINLIISGNDNYYYVHCIWHLTIMLSVAFLLPLKDEEDKWYLSELEKSTYVPLL